MPWRPLVSSGQLAVPLTSNLFHIRNGPDGIGKGLGRSTRHVTAFLRAPFAGIGAALAVFDVVLPALRSRTPRRCPHTADKLRAQTVSHGS